MNQRAIAIANAKHFRIGNIVYIIEEAVAAKDAVKDEEGNIIEEAVQASPRQYHSVAHKQKDNVSPSISLAKKHMRELGIGVALVKGEKLPL